MPRRGMNEVAPKSFDYSLSVHRGLVIQPMRKWDEECIEIAGDSFEGKREFGMGEPDGSFTVWLLPHCAVRPDVDLIVEHFDERRRIVPHPWAGLRVKHLLPFSPSFKTTAITRRDLARGEHRGDSTWKHLGKLV